MQSLNRTAAQDPAGSGAVQVAGALPAPLCPPSFDPQCKTRTNEEQTRTSGTDGIPQTRRDTNRVVPRILAVRRNCTPDPSRGLVRPLRWGVGLRDVIDAPTHERTPDVIAASDHRELGPGASLRNSERARLNARGGRARSTTAREG